MSDVFILGAGFSKAINQLMPTMPELTDAVSDKLETLAGYEEARIKIGLPPPLKDTEDSDKELENNIELWMTYLSQSQPWLDESWNQYNRAVASQIRMHIRSVIDSSTLASMNPTGILANGSSSKPLWLDSLIQQWHHRDATVLTLNYDTLVERASANLPAVSGGISTYDMYPPYFSAVSSRSRSSFGFAPRELETFTYLKLHGSVNWHYSGREDFFGETIYYSPVSPWGQNLAQPERDSLELAGDKAPLIIPPVTEKTTYFNNETVRRMWLDASQALSSATRVFVIGYSLPISDLGMQFFLKRSLPTKHTTWYIVDTSKRVLPRYRKLLMPFQTMNSDFVCEHEPVKTFADSYPNVP